MDGIPVDVLRCLGEEGIDMLWDLMKGIYEQEKIPTEWRDSVIIPIYKEKGDIQDCGNYRWIIIKLMSHTMKIWERIIDRRLREETTIGDEQFGFMPGRGTTDAIFAVRQLMEKHREKQKGLHIVFIDVEKAYSASQEVWRCMREKGVPEKYLMIIQDMYEGARTRVKGSVGLTDMIPVGVWLHQGSSLSPYLLPFRHDYGCVGPQDKGYIPVVHVICLWHCIVWHQKWSCWKETRRVEKGYGRQMAEDQ